MMSNGIVDRSIVAVVCVSIVVVSLKFSDDEYKGGSQMRKLELVSDGCQRLSLS